MTPVFSTVLEAIFFHVEAAPDKTAVVDREGKITYGKLAEMLLRAACNLRKRGVQKGDRVCLSAVPCARFVAAYFACHYIGAVAVPVNKEAAKDTLELMRTLLETQFLFLEDGFAAETKGAFNLSELFKECGKESEPSAKLESADLATILFTSGTTGKPKGIMLSHRGICGGALNLINGLGLNSDIIWLGATPNYQMGAVGAIHAIFYTGGTFVFESGWSSIKNIYNAINDNMCAGTFCTLSIINLLIKQTKDNLYKIFGPLRVIRLGGMSIPVEIKEKLLKELPDTNVVDMYGATECSVGVMSSWRENKNKLDAVGKPQKGVKLKIVDENDITITLPANAIGRIAMSSNATMLGYWRNEGAATENLVDGYFVSNDIGYLDEEGFLYLLGRTDDVINVGGKKLFPLEIEAFANKTFDEIDECCCIAVDDPLGICGQIPVLYIKKKEGMPFFEQSIQDRFMQSFEKYKVPHRILCIDKIPKTDGGKYRRSELKNLWNESHGNKSAGEKR